MNIDATLNDDAVLKILGERIAGVRLSLNLTQQQLAEQAGLGLRTVQRLELGAAATQLSGFVRVCRVLGLLERLGTLFPEPVATPMEQLKLRGRRRRRAAGKRATGPAGPWTWGDPA